MLVLAATPALGLTGQWVRERWRGAFSDARRFLLLRSRKQIRLQLKEDQTRLAGKLEKAYEEWRASAPKET